MSPGGAAYTALLTAGGLVKDWVCILCVCARVHVCSAGDSHLCCHHMLQFYGASKCHLGVFVLWNKLLLVFHSRKDVHACLLGIGTEAGKRDTQQSKREGTPLERGDSAWAHVCRVHGFCDAHFLGCAYALHMLTYTTWHARNACVYIQYSQHTT